MLLVTGITGNSGRYFLKELIENSYEDPIRCIVRSSSNTSLIDNCSLSIEKAIGNLDDQDFLDKSMVGVDTIIHIAGIHRSLNVMRGAIKNNVKKVILVHTTGIFSKYKAASEVYKNIESELRELIKYNDSNINVIILRPTMIYGNLNDLNMSKFIKMVDMLRIFPVVSQGKGLIQPVNVRDLGKAYYQVISSSSLTKGEYILSGQKPISMLKTFKLISKNLGKRTLFISFPLGISVSMAKMIKTLSLSKVDYVEKVQRMGENRNFEHNDATNDFGYTPISFEEGIKLEVEEYLHKKKGY